VVEGEEEATAVDDIIVVADGRVGTIGIGGALVLLLLVVVTVVAAAAVVVVVLLVIGGLEGACTVRECSRRSDCCANRRPHRGNEHSYGLALVWWYRR
jgi:hypothetical protein